MTLIAKIALAVVGLLILTILTLWGWVLISSQPLSATPTRLMPWPVACSTRGCITTTTIRHYADIGRKYSDHTGRNHLTDMETLTILIHQHLVHYAQVKQPISLADATRYRESVLNLTQEAAIAEATGLTPIEYDQLVVLPFLEQENVRQSRQAESTTDLWQQLANERWMVVLPLTWKWDVDTATVKES